MIRLLFWASAAFMGMALAGCGPSLDIDDELEPHFDLFTTDTHYSPDMDIVVRFGPVPNGAGAYCELWPDAFTVTVDKAQWYAGSDDYKLHILYHELSHCALSIHHSKNEGHYMYSAYRPLSSSVIRDQARAY